MRRLIKYVPILMSVLSPVFLFSVGFSSWFMVNPLPSVEVLDGSFQAYEANDYIEWGGTSMFEYTSTYFVESERTSYELGEANVGMITVTYRLTNTGKEIASDSGLKINFRLSYTDANGELLFKPSNTVVTVNGTEHILSGESSQVVVAHTFNSTSGIPSDTFNVVYTFNTTVGAGFRSEFGQYFFNNKDGVTTKFITSAEAEVSK